MLNEGILHVLFNKFLEVKQEQRRKVGHKLRANHSFIMQKNRINCFSSENL